VGKPVGYDVTGDVVERVGEVVRADVGNDVEGDRVGIEDAGVLDGERVGDNVGVRDVGLVVGTVLGRFVGSAVGDAEDAEG
jgi:hypothetical protein